MADEDVGGIKVGLTADMSQLREALSEADKLISGKAQQLRDRQITMSVYAKVDNATFGKIERDLNTVVKRAQERNAFKFSPLFTVAPGSIRTLQREMGRASRQAGGIKVPIIPELDADLIRAALQGQAIPVGVNGEWKGWLGNQIPEVVVNVRGHFTGWDEGGAPPEMGPGPGPDQGPGPATRRRGGSRVKPPPPSAADVQPEAKETGKAVASNLQDTPVKTETSSKEKTERKSATRSTSRPPSSGGLPYANVEEYLATPANRAAIESGRADEAMLRRVFAKAQEAAVEDAQKQADLEGRLAKRAKDKAPSARQRPPSTASARNASERAEMEAENRAIASQPAYGPQDAEPLTAAEEADLRAVRLDRAKRYLEERKARVPKPVTTAKAASTEAIAAVEELKAAVAGATAADLDWDEPVSTAKDAVKAAAAEARDAAADAGRMARARVDVVMQGMRRAEEMPSATPLPETAGNQAVCQFCHQVFTKRGLTRHIQSAHKAEVEGLTPGGFSREELSRARASGTGIMATGKELRRGPSGAWEEVVREGSQPFSESRESALIRRMFEENREIGEILPSPDMERVLGLIEKGLDPDAMAMGLLQPMAELAEDKQKELLNDPEFKSLQSDYEQAIEARRKELKAEFADELKRTAQNPDRPLFRLEALRGAVEDPTAGIAHSVGARRGRAARRAEIGISEEALTGFRASDVIRGLRAGGEGEMPPGWEEAIQAYAKGEAAGRQFDVDEQREMDKALLAYKDPTTGAWNFGSDMDQLRGAMAQALEEPSTISGWFDRALAGGADPSRITGMRHHILDAPNDEVGRLRASRVIDELRREFGADPRLLEEVRRMAFGPAPGEDVSELPKGDIRRTGMTARIRRAAIRGANNPEAQRLRFNRLFDPNRPLKRLRGPELEFIEAAGIGAQASALLDIIDQQRNQEQSTDQAKATRAANIAGRERAAARPNRNTQEYLVEQARADEERFARDAARAAEAAAANATAPDIDASRIIDVGETDQGALSAEDAAALRIAEETKPADCPCGWSGSQGQFAFHAKGERHQRWLQMMNPSAGPRAFAGEYNPEAQFGAPIPGRAGESLSERIARVQQQAGTGFEQGLVGSATPAEEPFQPAWMRRQSAKDLTRYASGGGPEGFGIGRMRAEAISIAEDQPDVTVAGAAASSEPPATRWCQVCARPISNRMWGRHIAGKTHQRNMQRVNQRTRDVLREEGLPIPADLEDINRRQVEEAIQTPPPVLAMAGVGLEGLSAGERKDLKMIASTASGRRQLAEQGFDVDEILGAESARAKPVEAEGPEEPRRATVRQSEIRNLIGSEEVDRIRQSVSDETASLISSSNDIKDAGNAILKENPVRALSVAVGQVLVQTIGGRAKLETQIKDFNRAVAREQQLIKRQGVAESAVQEARLALTEARASGDEEMVTRLEGEEGEIARRENILERARRAVTRQQEEQVQPQAAALQAGRRRFALTTLGVGTVGIVAGTALFTAAMTAFNAAMEQGTAWVGRMTDEMTGFATQANALARSLGEGALPTGRTEGAIRERLGLAGVGGATADALVGPIQQRVQGEVQAQRAILMRDTAALAAQSLRMQVPGIQNFAGNFQPTGGLVVPGLGQTNIGATPSVQETLAGAITGIGDRTVPGGNGIVESQARQLVDIFSGGQLSREITAVQQREWEAIVGGWTDAMQRGGFQGDFISPELEGRSGLESQLRLQADALRASGGSPDLARRIQEGEIALVDENGNLVTSIREVSAAFDALGQGLETPDLEQILKAGARQLEAAFYGIAQSLQNTLANNPIQTAMQLAASPIAPFGTGVNLGMLGAGVTGPQGLINFGLRTQMEQRAAAGRNQIVDLAERFGPQAGVSVGDVTGTLSQINVLGEQIVGWQTQIAEMQLGQQMSEYNRQVFVAQRNISDLRGLVEGVGDAQEGNIGILQRENLMRQRRIQDIQREAQAEQLAQNQRQINFNLAVAGFTSSGATPAEAAAQMEQARREAEFAQRQQDRNVEIFGIEGEMIPAERQIVDEQNLRALQDAIAEFDLFQSRFTMDQQTRLMADNIALAQQLQQGLVTDMQAMLGALQQAQSVEVQMVQDAFTRGSETLWDTANAVKGVYEDVARSFARSFDITITGTRTSSMDSGTTAGRDSGGSGAGYASGTLFNTSGAYNMTVGEAGTETVAVLRNPRRMTWGGGGGAVQININNPVVRDETDITALAKEIERVMSQRARMYGA